MDCHVVLHSALRDRLKKEVRGRVVLTLPEGSRIVDIITALQLPQGCVCVINGLLIRDLSRILVEGEEVHFLRQTSGG